MPRCLIIPDQSTNPTIERMTGNDTTVYEENAVTDLPAFEGTQNASVDNVTAVLTFNNASGTVSSTASPSNTTKVWDSSANTFTITGTMANVNAVLAGLQYTSIADEQVDIFYNISLKDNDDNETSLCSNGELKLVTGTLLKDYKESCTGTLTLTGTNGTIQLLTKDNNGDDIATISGTVPFNSNTATTVQDLVINVTATTSTPQFTSKEVGFNNSQFKVCAPKGLGADANGFFVVAVTTGDLSISGNINFNGGSDGTDIKDLFKQAGLAAEKWGLVDIVGGLLDDALNDVTNPDLSQIRLDIPNPNEPIEQVRVKWRGRNVVHISNDYDPVNKTYSGGWDLTTFGTPSYTNNPAWCLLDFISNNSFGVANEIYNRMTLSQKMVFHNDIYLAAQRCDEIVNGKHRYTLNGLITNKRTNTQIINDIAGVMHAQVLFLPSNVIRLVQDRPRTPVLLVNQSGVAEEGFSYATKSPKTTYDKVQVSFYDPEKYAQLVTVEEEFSSFETVRDSSILNIVAWGVDNVEQAIRHSRKVAHDENATIVTTKYLGALDHQNIIPGDVIRILDEWNESDPNAYGGRVKSTFGLKNITVDREISISGNPTIHITMPDGTYFTTTISNAVGNNMTLTDFMPEQPILGAKFNITDGQDYVVTKISRKTKGIYEVFGIPYDPAKYTAIDL